MIDLPEITRSLFASGKGILAADESNGSADKRLTAFNIVPGPEMRRKNRELFLEAPGIEKFLSGVILFSETFDQEEDDGTLFRESLAKRGIALGIKVDQGTEPMPGHPDEFITNGLVGLPERLADFKARGAVFTKWRAVIRIEGDVLPTAGAIVENAKRLATYACEVQRAGMVPILEPEVLLEGTHSRVRCREVMKTALGATIAQVLEQCADPSAIIIKTSMALSGKNSKKKDTPEEVAEDTLEALLSAIPKEVGGIVFLSGGETPDQAMANFAAIMKLAKEKQVPWPITFSFARAFQEEALTVWQGKDENVEAARAAYVSRLKEASAAVI